MPSGVAESVSKRAGGRCRSPKPIEGLYCRLRRHRNKAPPLQILAQDVAGHFARHAGIGLGVFVAVERAGDAGFVHLGEAVA